MRLLAYGGTSLIERCRFGKWPAIPEGALGDRSSLIGGDFSYGVGIDDLQPFLILRQRQNLENRGGYAFTLLLDPGENVWQNFGWNPAALALSLLNNALGPKLLSKPEDCSEQEIIDALDSLGAPKLRVETASDFDSMWVGAIVSDQRAMISPTAFGFEGRPAIDKLAANLAGLQPCFRCANGWLVGGSKEHGKAFRVSLILDEGSTDAVNVFELLEAGRTILSYWNVVAKAERYEQTLARHATTPIFRWNKRFHESPNEILTGIKDVANYLIGGKDAAETAPDYRGSTFDVDRARYSAALSGSHLLNQQLTSLVLSHHFDNGWTLPQKELPRLYPQTVIEELVGRRTEPTKAETGLEFRPEIRFDVWRRLLDLETQVELIPSRLRAAIEDLFEDSLNPSMLYVDLNQLVVAAIEKTTGLAQSLRVWVEFRDDPILSLFVVSSLHAEAVRRAQESAPNWPLDYLAFGDDDGGTVLSQILPDTKTAGLFVMSLERVAAGQDILSEYAKRWLTELATSPYRALVPLQQKIEFAKTLNGNWQRLTELWMLYCGQAPSSNLNCAVDASEKAILRGELREMVKLHRVGSAVPDLQGMVNLLGPLETDEIELLANLRPPLTSKSADRWLAGWRALNQEEIFQRELVRIIQATDKAPEGYSFDQLDENSLQRLIKDALVSGDEEDDTKCRSRLVNIAKRIKFDIFEQTITSALREAILDPNERLTLGRRFRKRSAATEQIFRCLDDTTQDAVVVIFEEGDRQQLEMEALELYTKAIDSLQPLAEYDRAVLRFLRRRRSERMKNRIATLYHSILEMDNIDENLECLLDDKPAEKPEQHHEPAADSFSDWVSSSLKPVLPDRLHTYLFEVDRAGQNTARRGRVEEHEDEALSTDQETDKSHSGGSSMSD